MIGLLFHGPQIFDNGWAARFLNAFPRQRFMLAGTMARTALLDSGLAGIETPGCQSSQGVDLLAENCETVILVSHSKSTESGLALGPMVAERIRSDVTLLQAETNGKVWTACAGQAPDEIAEQLKALGLEKVGAPVLADALWSHNGTDYRRLHAPAPGDQILINGIYVGTALSDEVVVSVRDGTIRHITNTDIKPHGLEKLERFGPIDLASAKFVSTSQLRAEPEVVATQRNRGEGVAFIDHAGASVYELAQDCAGAVVVGDDTTAIVGDILRRFDIPVLGIVDGDSDGLYTHGGFAPGSMVLRVAADDEAGLRVQATVFDSTTRSQRSFPEIREETLELLGSEILERREY